MNENLRAILQAVSEDDELKAQATALMGELGAASDEDRPEVVARIVALANERGFALAEDDLVIEAPAEGEVEDETLAVVAGGCTDKGCGAPSATSTGKRPTHGRTPR